MDIPRRPVEPVVRVHELRASDGDRERVAAVLNEAMADGRLTPDEHTERITLLYRARTLGELTGLTTDLSPAEAQPIQVDDRPLLATFGSRRREGRWVVPVRVPVFALFGTVELDLREAILQRRHIVIDSNVLCGRVRLLVPEGVHVDVTGRTILSTSQVRVRPAGDGPVIEISGTMLFGSVQARSPRRTLRQRVRARLRGAS